MQNSIIAEGKTTTEAINNGLKQLNVSKDRVDIKVLENKEIEFEEELLNEFDISVIKIFPRNRFFVG